LNKKLTSCFLATVATVATCAFSSPTEARVHVAGTPNAGILLVRTRDQDPPYSFFADIPGLCIDLSAGAIVAVLGSICIKTMKPR
jgi:hypothetical protein